MGDSLDELCISFDKLPMAAGGPLRPFTGMVINISGVCLGHRDIKDQRFCLDLVVSDCTGGWIVLEELGIVVHLRNGDFMIFPSNRITHWNTHYKGIRNSMIFMTDKEMSKWSENCNGWEDCVYWNYMAFEDK